MAQCQGHRIQMVRLFLGLHQHWTGVRCSKNSQSVRGPTQCKSGPSKNIVWPPSFQPVLRGATIVFQLDRFTQTIACSPFVVYCQKSIHGCFHNRRLVKMDLNSSLSCHYVGSRKKRLIIIIA